MGIASAIPFDFFCQTTGEEKEMRELLEFIFAVVFLVIAFKLTMGCMKVVLWLAGTLLLVYAFLALIA